MELGAQRRLNGVCAPLAALRECGFAAAADGAPRADG